MILVVGVATAGIAFGALVLVAFALLVVRVLECTDVAGREAPGDEDEFSVDPSPPEWWPQFEDEFARACGDVPPPAAPRLTSSHGDASCAAGDGGEPADPRRSADGVARRIAHAQGAAWTHRVPVPLDTRDRRGGNRRVVALRDAVAGYGRGITGASPRAFPTLRLRRPGERTPAGGDGRGGPARRDFRAGRRRAGPATGPEPGTTPMALLDASHRRRLSSRRPPPDDAAPTEPFRSPADSGWGFRCGDALAPGRRVIRRLGDGGAHEAFLIETGGSRLAAAKLPRRHLASDFHRLVSLRDEGRALRRLASPAVPRHLDTVLSGPRPHLLMEYVAGPTLHTAIAARGPLPASLVAGLGRALALGLDAIGRAGWVHLDVKPSNIVLGATPRLLDFELARPAFDAANISAPTGTWRYMPPEQRAAGTGRGAPIGPPADVFALALALGEALAGRSLGRSPEPEAPSGAVGAVLADALAPAPGDRPRAGELATALARLADEPRPALAA